MDRFIPAQEMVRKTVRVWIDIIARKSDPTVRHVQSIKALSERPRLVGHVHATNIGDYDMIVMTLQHHAYLQAHSLTLYFDRDIMAFVIEPKRKIVTVELPA